MSKFPRRVFVTTAIDYANAVIHIGHAYEKILADTVARYYRARIGENNVYFLTGTDKHGTSTQKAADKAEKPVEEYTDEIAQASKEQIDALNISYDRFIQTTDPDHIETVQEFFKKALETGMIYKGTYEGLYCEGCEAYKTLSELDENGQCALHPTRKIQHVEEENYFFKWSAFQKQLEELLNSNEQFILPKAKRNEMLSFLKRGVQDIPVSRPKYKVPWGIEVPGDPEQVIYVWYDALTNYYTAGSKTGFWDKDTKIIHFVGKDILRWHTLLWPAMLMNLKLPLPSLVYAHGFINLEGQKISKSRGNVLYPKDLVEKYGTDAIRYYFLKYGPITEDSDFSIKHLEDTYQADLAKGLGNTVARIAKLAENSGLVFPMDEKYLEQQIQELWDKCVDKPLETYRVDLAIQNLWNTLSELDKHINENEPWKETDTRKLQQILNFEVNSIRAFATVLTPFLPESSAKIKELFEKERIVKGSSLFPRL